MRAHTRRYWVRLGIGVLAAVVLCASGAALYRNERGSHQEIQQLGEPNATAWLELDVTTQRVDTGGEQLIVSVLPVPHGAVAEGPESLVFAKPITVATTSLARSSFKIAAGDTGGLQQLSMPLDGIVTDYPFDRYAATIGFAAASGGDTVPVVMATRDADPLFRINPTKSRQDSGTVEMDVRISRSYSTFVLAWFMMLAMWALSLSVAVATGVLIRKKPGLVWPALGWMAATMFALIGMRNAAPGSPPIGSLIDYVAFFWAEGLIAACFTAAALSGARTEHRTLNVEEA